MFFQVPSTPSITLPTLNDSSKGQGNNEVVVPLPYTPALPPEQVCTQRGRRKQSAARGAPASSCVPLHPQTVTRPQNPPEASPALPHGTRLTQQPTCSSSACWDAQGRNCQVSTGRVAQPQRACLAPPAPPGTLWDCRALARCGEGFLQPGCKAAAALAGPQFAAFSYCCNLNVLVWQIAAAKLPGIKLRKILRACRYSEWPAQLFKGVSHRHTRERKQRLRKPAVFFSFTAFGPEQKHPL